MLRTILLSVYHNIRKQKKGGGVSRAFECNAAYLNASNFRSTVCVVNHKLGNLLTRDEVEVSPVLNGVVVGLACRRACDSLRVNVVRAEIASYGGASRLVHWDGEAKLFGRVDNVLCDSIKTPIKSQASYLWWEKYSRSSG